MLNAIFWFSTSYCTAFSSPQKQLIHWLQDRLILLKPQGAETRGGLHNQGKDPRRLVRLSCLQDLLVIMQHLQWI
jgi:hypothetical protein